MKVLTSLILVAAGTTAFILAGCGDDNGMMSRESVLVARTIPSAGESAYDPGAPIHIKFSAGMDTARFHERFFFLDATMHDSMHDSLGQGMMPDSTMANCDSMVHGMMDSGMHQMMGMRGGRHGGMNNNGIGFDMMDPMKMSMLDNESHMVDPSAFYRGMHERRQRGQFQWNATLDSCVFTPDAPMVGGRDYVVMMRSMGGQIDSGRDSDMMDNGRRDLMVRFRTR